MNIVSTQRAQKRKTAGFRVKSHFTWRKSATKWRDDGKSKGVVTGTLKSRDWKTREWKSQEKEKYGKRRFQKCVSDYVDWKSRYDTRMFSAPCGNWIKHYWCTKVGWVWGDFFREITPSLGVIPVNIAINVGLFFSLVTT